MTDQPIYDRASLRRMRSTSAPVEAVEPARSGERKLSLVATLDKPLLLIVALLLAIGAGMVYSTTFDWSFQEYGSNTTIFVRDHLRNVVLGLAGLVIFSVVDYRFWKRFAPWILLVTIGALVAVLLFGDDTFGARRSLIAGRLQPGELAEFTIIIYMAAWLGAKNTRVSSFFFGLLPFSVLLGIIALPIVLQPDLSAAVIIVTTAVAMFFLAGARAMHLVMAVALALTGAFFFVQTNPYAQQRLDSYSAGLIDPTQSNYHTQQAIIAFVNGGWFGRGLGQGEQKFGFLPAPHTDSIFAVIGEELGVMGASFVVLLYFAFVIRGFQIARRAVDVFGALLAIGFTLWVAIQALLNIAVMTAVVPSSGLPLPFISYGGSNLLVLMIGVGMMQNVNRVAAQRRSIPRRRNSGANSDRGWGNGRTRVSRPVSQ